MLRQSAAVAPESEQLARRRDPDPSLREQVVLDIGATAADCRSICQADLARVAGWILMDREQQGTPAPRLYSWRTRCPGPFGATMKHLRLPAL